VFAPIATTFVLAAGAAGAQQAPNPAAAFCLEEGGRYEIVEETGGARSVCVLPDGRRVDAWDHFRERMGRGGDGQRLANPAAVFCTEQGGRYRIETDAAGARGHCTLPDGRDVDAWEYFREQHG
jgi:putative hemolysin